MLFNIYKLLFNVLIQNLYYDVKYELIIIILLMKIINILEWDKVYIFIFIDMLDFSHIRLCKLTDVLKYLIRLKERLKLICQYSLNVLPLNTFWLIFGFYLCGLFFSLIFHINLIYIFEKWFWISFLLGNVLSSIIWQHITILRMFDRQHLSALSL